MSHFPQSQAVDYRQPLETTSGRTERGCCDGSVRRQFSKDDWVTVAQFAALAPTIGLTKLDECETTPAEFSALAESGASISLLSGTKSVVGAIAFASGKIQRSI